MPFAISSRSPFCPFVHDCEYCLKRFWIVIYKPRRVEWGGRKWCSGCVCVCVCIWVEDEALLLLLLLLLSAARNSCGRRTQTQTIGIVGAVGRVKACNRLKPACKQLKHFVRVHVCVCCVTQNCHTIVFLCPLYVCVCVWVCLFSCCFRCLMGTNISHKIHITLRFSRFGLKTSNENNESIVPFHLQLMAGVFLLSASLVISWTLKWGTRRPLRAALPCTTFMSCAIGQQLSVNFSDGILCFSFGACMWCRQNGGNPACSEAEIRPSQMEK